MAPRRGRDGPCQAGQGSRHSRHGGTKTVRCGVRRQVSSCPPLPRLLTSSRRPVYKAATRLDQGLVDGDRGPKFLLQGALDPSSDPWETSLPTCRVFCATSAAGPWHPSCQTRLPCSAQTNCSSHLPHPRRHTTAKVQHASSKQLSLRSRLIESNPSRREHLLRDDVDAQHKRRNQAQTQWPASPSNRKHGPATAPT